jgi:hypothetical protein
MKDQVKKLERGKSYTLNGIKRVNVMAASSLFDKVIHAELAPVGVDRVSTCMR